MPDPANDPSMNRKPDPSNRGSGETPPCDRGGKPDKDSAGKVLTPEEQLARFEEALKEEDWGHQPC